MKKQKHYKLTIGVIGVTEQKLQLPLRHIAQLFFDEVKIQLGSGVGCDLVVNIPAELEKNEILKCFSLFLQEHTGVVPKWGILTGVRPLKLYHLHRKNFSPADARQILNSKYLVSHEKIDLMEKIARRQCEVISNCNSLDQEVSVYIGIPFCPTKCAYCTFTAYPIANSKQLVDKYLEQLHTDICALGNFLRQNNRRVTSIYFGGGTPTSLNKKQLDFLFAPVFEFLSDPHSTKEITVEAGRPDTLDDERLAVLQKWNIDRISVNPQTFCQKTLDLIGRHHTVTDTVKSFKKARALKFKSINMDIIVGLPDENLEILRKSFSVLSDLKPDVLTVHTLAFKRASTISQNRDAFSVATRKEVLAMMDFATKWCDNFDYLPYYLYRQQNILGNLENIGYSKWGHESIYNILIMEEMQTIIGLGCGAVSKLVMPKNGKIVRLANPRNLQSYLENAENNRNLLINYLRKIFI